jgi:hypothetical protein
MKSDKTSKRGAGSDRKHQNPFNSENPKPETNKGKESQSP